MEKKGLCITCINDRECTFPRRFPVLECEEFTNKESDVKKLTKVKKNQTARQQINR